METTLVNLRLPDNLLEKTAVAAEVMHKNRTEIIVKALQDYLEELEDNDEFKEAVIELYLDDQIGFDILKEFIDQQDAKSVRASKALLDQDNELADELTEL